MGRHFQYISLPTGIPPCVLPLHLEHTANYQMSKGLLLTRILFLLITGTCARLVKKPIYLSQATYSTSNPSGEFPKLATRPGMQFWTADGYNHLYVSYYFFYRNWNYPKSLLKKLQVLLYAVRMSCIVLCK